MKVLFLPLALALSVGNCFNTSQTVVQNHDQGSGGVSGPSAPCDGVVASVNLDVEGGTTGGKAAVGAPVSLSLDPRGADGGTIPSACKGSQVSVQVAGPCALAAVPSLESIVVTPSAPGTCVVTATFGGQSDTASFVVE
jgi:hypothetical protein